MFSGKELDCETWNTKTDYFGINTLRDDETTISLTLWCLYTLVHVVIRVPVRRHKYGSNCVFPSMSKFKLFCLQPLPSFINEELPHQHPLMPSASDLPEKSIQTFSISSQWKLLEEGAGTLNQHQHDQHQHQHQR